MEEGTELGEPYVQANREAWNNYASDYVDAGYKGWLEDEPQWGVFQIPESEVNLLKEFRGGDVVELGCGTAYVSAWLARRNGNPIGIDNSPAQLATAASFQKEFDLEFPLIFGNAELLPFKDESFDFAISEYGASIWCDPNRWIPEAARVLRPGGRLVILENSVILMLCQDWEVEALSNGEKLLQSQFGMHRFEDLADNSVEFHISHGEKIQLFRSCGFEIEELIELKPPEGSEETKYEFVDLEWASKWPAEEAWIVQKK